MRLATFNILHGRTPADGLVEPARLAEAVRILDPDILALQEVDRDQPRSHGSDLTAVAAEAMGAVSHRFVAALSGTPGLAWQRGSDDDPPGTAAYGIALLARYPVLDWEVLRLPRIPFPFPFWRPSPFRLITITEEPRAALIGRFDTPDGPLQVAATHLSFVPGWGRWQLHRLRTHLARRSGPAVVMGDLNLANPGPVRTTGFRSLARHPTFPAYAPRRQIDHILIRGARPRVTSSAALELGLSDHRALVVETALARVGDTTS